MTRKGVVWYAEGHMALSHGLPWTAAEDVILSRGFIDQDLEGIALYEWCVKHGLMRSAGAMDNRLVELCFFDAKVKKSHNGSGRGQPRGTFPDRHKRARSLADAQTNLANQIRLAKLEAKLGLPPFKPKDL